MRIIKNESDYKNKFGDTSTAFRLNLYDDNTLVDTTNKSLKLNIANDKGLVLSKDITTDYSGYIDFDFSDESIQKLTPDNYLLEIELPIDGQIAKYPTTGGFGFVVTKSLNETTGELVNTITFDEVLKSVDDKIAVYMETVKKGDKGDTGEKGDKGEDGINGKDGVDGKDGIIDTTKPYIWSDTQTYEKVIQGVVQTKQTPATITSILDLVNAARTQFGGWFNVTYISSNRSFSDAPTTEAYGTVEIVTRGTTRTYLTFTDRDGLKYYSSVVSGVLSPWYKAAVIDSSGNLQVSSITSTSGNYTVVTSYQGEF